MVKSITSMFGLLEVKITAKVRKRGFTPWKAWKKQWCNLKRTSNGLELVIFNAVPSPGVFTIPIQSVIIPDTCVCFRTDSRTKQFAFGLFFNAKCRKAIMYLAGCSETNSQEWIYAIRTSLNDKQNFKTNVSETEISYTVSLIDNAHSRAAGFYGVYGKMIVTENGLSIYQPQRSDDINNSSVIHITWFQIEQCHLAGKRGSVDERRICTVHTNENFCNGVGQLSIYCEDAPKLLHAIMIHSNKILTTKLCKQRSEFIQVKQQSIERLTKPVQKISINEDKLVSKASVTSYSPCHRISRSEGDLCGYCDYDRDSGWSSCSPPDNNSIFIDDLEKKLLIASSNHISDEFKALMHNEKNKDESSLNNSDNSESRVALHINLPEICEPIDPRRASGVSIASGVYEEILEISPVKPLNALYEEPVFMPPPLPPRGRHTSQTSTSDEGMEDCDDCNCSTPITARSVHNFNDHGENICKNSILCNNDYSIRKYSLSSLDEAHIHSTFCFNNAYCKKNTKEMYCIPRCNTEPQTTLKTTQISSTSNNIDAGKKFKNRFDLTPIKNKLNYLIRKSNMESNNSPKCRSQFYNSLPRSLNISKSKEKESNSNSFRIKETSRSCEILDYDLTDSTEFKKNGISCDMLDCITIEIPKSDHNINHDKISDPSYHNLNNDNDLRNNSLVEKPNFLEMQEEWLQKKKILNETECEYVPMSPGIIFNFELQENDYVDMTGTNKC